MALAHRDDPRIPTCLSERQISEIVRALKRRDGRGRPATVTLKRSTFLALLARLGAFSDMTFALANCEHCGEQIAIALCPPIKHE